jgi:hypothetical protein
MTWLNNFDSRDFFGARCSPGTSLKDEKWNAVTLEILEREDCPIAEEGFNPCGEWQLK